MSRILLVEPDTILGKNYQQVLVSVGHDVQRSTSAAGALDALDEQAIELIVLELLLGSHNGVEFLYEIRSYADLQGIPVIVHSSVAPATVRSSPGYQLLGIQQYLYKSDTTQAQLIEAVEDALSANAARK
jgi:CheY-like chemotaxis protein